MIMWRPVGLFELVKIAASGWRAFPPRLLGQPIFYPVLTRRYAEDIARDWNVSDSNSGYCGFVTEFDVDDACAARYPVRIVGAEDVARELWVPAEELDDFNAAIIGTIAVVATYYGPSFQDRIDEASGLPADLVAAHGAPPPRSDGEHDMAARRGRV